MNKREAIQWLMDNPANQVVVEGCKPWKYEDGVFFHQDNVDDEWKCCDPLINMTTVEHYYPVDEKSQWIVRATDGSYTVTENKFTEAGINEKLKAKFDYTIVGRVSSKKFLL